MGPYTLVVREDRLTAQLRDQDRVIASYREGVSAICGLADTFSDDDWTGQTPCTDWEAVDLAGHLRCMADDYLEWLDEGPNNRLARLMAQASSAAELARQRARQNAAELALLRRARPSAHIEAFAAATEQHVERLPARWHQPCFSYAGRECMVGDHAGAACVEWHVHAWDLARTIGRTHRPADPELLATAWHAAVPQHQPFDPPAGGGDPWEGVLAACGRLDAVPI